LGYKLSYWLGAEDYFIDYRQAEEFTQYDERKNNEMHFSK
jgi:hypothetical protein